MDRVYDCDNRFVPPKIKVFYLVFLGNEGLGKKEDYCWRQSIMYTTMVCYICCCQRCSQDSKYRVKCNCGVYKKLLKHPFLKYEYDRFKCMSNMYESRINENLILPNQWKAFTRKLQNLGQYHLWRQQPRLAGLNNIYRYNGATYSDGATELLRFMRNISAHLVESPRKSRIEKDMMRLYPEFFTNAYQIFPHLGTHNL